jgi:hypothetical protein
MDEYEVVEGVGVKRCGAADQVVLKYHIKEYVTAQEGKQG